MTKATRGQVIMLLELWTKAKSRISIEGGSDRERRLNWSEKETGRRVASWSDLGRRDDVDRLKGALLAIVAPANLNAQLRQQNMAKTRKLYGIRKFADRLYRDGLTNGIPPEDYIYGIARTMNSEGKLGSSDLDSLEPNELEKVMIALRQHERRGMVHEMARVEDREPAEVPF